jgi:hypothetical protein
MLSLVAMRSRSCHWLLKDALVLSLRLDRGDSRVRLSHKIKVKVKIEVKRGRERKVSEMREGQWKRDRE